MLAVLGKGTLLASASRPPSPSVHYICIAAQSLMCYSFPPVNTPVYRLKCFIFVMNPGLSLWSILYIKIFKDIDCLQFTHHSIGLHLSVTHQC